MKRIYERLDKLLEILKEKRFREQKGLGNEVGFHISDYDPEDELIVRERIRFIKDALKHEDFEIQEFDLYEIVLKILEEKGFLQKLFDKEEKLGTEKALAQLQPTLRLGEKDDLIVEHIRTHLKPNSIMFLTGIGKAWPVVRSHKTLNTLHAVVETVPLIMFFPGMYDGQSLVLFNGIKDDNYYRAFRLVER